MTRLIGPTLIAATSAVADIGGKLIEGHDVNIATAATIAAFTGTACLWISRQFAKRDLAEAERTKMLETKIAKIEQMIEDLPCPGRHRSCDDEERRHHR